VTAASDLLTGSTSDEDLVELACAGDDNALRELLDRFRPHVRSKARSYFLVGGDRQDVIQEAMIGLYKAVRDYDRTKHPSFRHFADICMTRQVISAVKRATRHKHAPLNSYVSLSSLGGDADGTERHDGVGVDHMASLTDRSPEPAERVAESSELEQLAAFCADVLSDLETKVLSRYVAGDSYADIAAELGRHTKAIDNALQRIKRKLEAYVAMHEGSAAT
jgi:RNA polymerase sporulation-specific sigma factor